MEHEDDFLDVTSWLSPSSARLLGSTRGSPSPHWPQFHADARNLPLVAEEILRVRPNDAVEDFEETKTRLEACRWSVNFQRKQCMHYLDRVRESGVDPQQLLTGIEFAESGSNMPSLDFMCLIAARDRLLLDLAALEAMERERQSYFKKICVSGGLGIGLTVLGLLANPTPWPFAVAYLPWTAVFGVSALTSAAYGAHQVVLAVDDWIREKKLETITERARRWDFGKQEDGIVQTALCFVLGKGS